MRKRLRRYLRAEWGLALLLSGSGSLGLLAGVFLMINRYSGVYRGLCWPAVLLGFLMLLYGIRNLRLARQLQRKLPPLLERAPATFIRTEKERLQYADRELRQRQQAEQLVLAIGVGLLLFGVIGSVKPFSIGIGAGLSSLAALLLIANLLQQWSRGLYRHEIDIFRRDGEL